MRPMISEIQAATCEYFGIAPSELMSSTRERRVSRPRQIAMFIARGMTRQSLPEIGRRFGGRDHTTIIHGIRQIERLIGEVPEVASDVIAVKAFVFCVMRERPRQAA